MTTSAFAAMASRLPRMVWAILLGGIFILACTTQGPPLSPTDSSNNVTISQGKVIERESYSGYSPIGWGVSLGSPNDPPPVGNGVVDVEIGGSHFLCNDIAGRHLSDSRIIAQTDLDRDLVVQLLAGYMMVLPYVEAEIPGPDISPDEAEQAWNTCTER